MKRLFSFGAVLMLSLSSLLLVNFGSVLAAGPFTCTWTGGGDGTSFSDAANWSGCNSAAPQPADNDDLVFDNSSLSNTGFLEDDISGLVVGNINFSGSNDTYAYAITSSNNYPITITDGVTDSTTVGYTGISTPLIISGDQTFSVASNTNFSSLQGSSNVSITGGGTASFYDNALTGPLNSYTGTVSSNNSIIELGAFSDTNFTSSGAVAVSGTAALDLFNNDGGKSNTPHQVTYNIAVSLGGNGVGKLGALNLDGNQDTNTTNTLAGAITLTSDVQVTATGSNTLNISGAVTYNSHSISSIGANVTTITISKGTDRSGENPSIGSGVKFIVDGVVGNATVKSNGLLEGNGTTGNLTVQSGGTTAPGHSPGCLNTGNLTLNGSLDEEIGGATACTEYDQLKVTGTVNVTNGTLNTSLYNGFKPGAGQSYTIIDNDGSDAVTGTFANLAEGATFTVDGNVLKITYKGGDGNDVVLSLVSVPATPNTGFGMLTTHPLATLLGTSLAAAGILGVSRRYNKFAKEQVK